MGTLVLLFSLLATNPSWPADNPNLEAEDLSHLERMPNDPDYPPIDAEDCRGQLELYSFTPECTPNIETAGRGLGSGIHADRAWLWTTGAPQVVIAFLDGAIDLGDPDLVSRFVLNRGELEPPQTSTTGGNYIHDLNEDGAFTVLDFTSATGTAAPTIATIRDRTLLARADSGDVNGNGILDPQDLIHVFSDGADTDDNGYADDICGWDFVEGDNDPHQPAGETTELARRAVGVANNGIGGVGVCPSCSALPVRVAAHEVAGGLAMASAIIYTAFREADVIATTVAVADWPPFLETAVHFAWDYDTLIVAAARQGSTRSRATPWPPDRVVIAGTIGYNRSTKQDSTSAIATDPCSRYGTQLTLTAPGRCDNRSTALVAGSAGLLLTASRGLKEKNVPPLEPRLSTGEIRQLLLMNTDDLALDETGFDERTGYGRVNARAAVDSVIQRRIPVAATLDTPRFFGLTDPDEAITVRGTIYNPRYERTNWQLDYAVGLAPAEETFISIAAGNAERKTEEITGTIENKSLFRDPTAPPETDESFAITIRLTTRGDDVVSRVRRVLFLHRDLELLPAFPLALSASAVASPRVVDLDGDGAEEIIIATTDGEIHVIDATGKPKRGWPQTTPRWPPFTPDYPVSYHHARAFRCGGLSDDVPQPIIATPAVIGGERLVVLTSANVLLSYNPQGELHDGFPITLGSLATTDAPAGTSQSPVLYDLDGDGIVEIIVSSADGQVHVIDVNGGEADGFPVDLGQRTGTPAVGDLDQDGLADIVLLSHNELFLLHGDGARHEGGAFFHGSPFRLEESREALGGDAIFLPVPILADTDQDGTLEIIVTTRGRPTMVFDATGTQKLVVASDRESFGGRTEAARIGAPLVAQYSHPTVADLDGDGVLEVAHPIVTEDFLEGLTPETIPEQLFGAWRLDTGAWADGFPREVSAPSANAIAADIDGDRRTDIIVSADARWLSAFSRQGTKPRLWPKLVAHAASAAAVGDLDGDGLLDVVLTTRDGLVFVWRSRGKRDHGLFYATFHHDNRSTGNLSTSLIEKKNESADEGCSCHEVDGVRSSALLVLFLLLGLRIRSR